MNVEKIVRKTMVQAFHNFSKENDVKPNEIKFYIQAKGKDDFDGRSKINYFYSVKNKVVQNEKGGVLYIPFVKIGGKKSALTGQGIVAGTFLKDFFKQQALELNILEEKLYLMLMPDSELAEDVKIFLYKETEIAKSLTLKEVFGSSNEKPH